MRIVFPYLLSLNVSVWFPRKPTFFPLSLIEKNVRLSDLKGIIFIKKENQTEFVCEVSNALSKSDFSLGLFEAVFMQMRIYMYS